MLRIREGHIEALSGQQAAGFSTRMAAHLREQFPDEVASLDEARLRMFIDKVRAKGEEWGIVDEAQVERLIELFVSFDVLRRRPIPEWVTEIVEYPGRPPEEILLRLEERLLFEEVR